VPVVKRVLRSWEPGVNRKVHPRKQFQWKDCTEWKIVILLHYTAFIPTLETAQLLVLHQEAFPLCEQSLKHEVNKTPQSKALNTHALNCSCTSHMQDISMLWRLTTLRDNFAFMFAQMPGKNSILWSFLQIRVSSVMSGTQQVRCFSAM